MASSVFVEEVDAIIQTVNHAAALGKISADAQKNILRWLREPGYEDARPELVRHIREEKWELLEDLFFTIIPFGTGGRRGRMYPIGTNAINDRTIAESAQGLANYVRQVVKKNELSCAIAYDTRHRSRHFAELCAEVMAAGGFRVFFLNGYRSTPQLSFTIRHLGCDCGIMVTASHNPPSDNAVKVYWSDGGQLVPPHDDGVIKAVEKVNTIHRIPFGEAVSRGLIQFVEGEADTAFVEAVLRQSRPGPRDLRILYSPLHGVGASAVVPVLKAAGFGDIFVYPRHAEPSGDFPNVPNHIANPELPEVFTELIHYARDIGADIVLATDPDCDRVGCAVRETLDRNSPWRLLTGNQIGALLAQAVIDRTAHKNQDRDHFYLVKTMVTTELIREVGEAHGVRVIGDLPVGFRWIAHEIEKRGPEGFLLGAEESYGFLIGTHARDKDAAVASLVICELAAQLKSKGKTLYEELISLFMRYGWYRERTISVSLPGKKGLAELELLMASLRSEPPRKLGELRVTKVRDYGRGIQFLPGGPQEPLVGPSTNTLFFETERLGNRAAVRPSGTEPKVKFYFFAFEPPQMFSDAKEAEEALEARLTTFEATMREEVRRRTSG
ncbi:MAG: phospho-sugar mutase [Thermoguttaceae bacterium]|nr:phospho-sugar mutase [Thermoguttaceae bacterium]MDW8079934.1 phospho-sugar mutase [Thermoguttaceae bacterium]